METIKEEKSALRYEIITLPHTSSPIVVKCFPSSVSHLTKQYFNFVCDIVESWQADADVMLEIANLDSFIHCCYDSSPMKTMCFHFSTSPALSHIPLSIHPGTPPQPPTLPPYFSLLNQSLSAASESARLTAEA